MAVAPKNFSISASLTYVFWTSFHKDQTTKAQTTHLVKITGLKRSLKGLFSSCNVLTFPHEFFEE